MNIGIILVILLILLLVGALPRTGLQQSYGYYPSGGIGLLVIILVILILCGRL